MATWGMKRLNPYLSAMPNLVGSIVNRTLNVFAASGKQQCLSQIDDSYLKQNSAYESVDTKKLLFFGSFLVFTSWGNRVII